MDDNLIDLKRMFLFDEQTGMIRPGLESMKYYAQIVNAETEEDLNDIILNILKETNPEEYDEIVEEEEN